jgi:hypothetical protein
MVNYSRIEQLAHDLSRPLYMLHMARGYIMKVEHNEAKPNDRLAKSAYTQRRNASAVIDKIVREYADNNDAE